MSEETKYKYPAIACEVLCSEIQVIYDTLFLNEDLLQVARRGGNGEIILKKNVLRF